MSFLRLFWEFLLRKALGQAPRGKEEKSKEKREKRVLAVFLEKATVLGLYTWGLYTVFRGSEHERCIRTGVPGMYTRPYTRPVHARSGRYVR